MAPGAAERVPVAVSAVFRNKKIMARGCLQEQESKVSNWHNYSSISRRLAAMIKGWPAIGPIVYITA